MKFRFADKIVTFNVDLSWIERWGQDQEQLARQERIRADLEATERFLTALRSDLPNG